MDERPCDPSPAKVTDGRGKMIAAIMNTSLAIKMIAARLLLPKDILRPVIENGSRPGGLIGNLVEDLIYMPPKATFEPEGFVAAIGIIDWPFTVGPILFYEVVKNDKFEQLVVVTAGTHLS